MSRVTGWSRIGTATLALATAIGAGSVGYVLHSQVPALSASTTGTQAAALSLNAPTSIIYTQTAHLYGRMTSGSSAVAGKPILIQGRQHGTSTWNTLSSLNTSGLGNYSYDHRPSTTSDYRVTFAGDDTYASATSPTRVVSVQNKIVSTLSPSVVGVGVPTSLSGYVSPAQADRLVYAQEYVGGSWTTRYSTRLSSTSTYLFHPVSNTYGTHTWRVFLGAGGGRADSYSTPRHTRVTYRFNTVVTLSGHQAVGAAYTHPSDSAHSSYQIGVARLSGDLLRAELHPGYSDPGGSWSLPDYLPYQTRAPYVAAFNSGFKLSVARGGFYLDGRSAYPLRTGAASFVMLSDGSWRLGQWGRDVGPAGNVVAVRQNLELLVDNSKPSATVDSDIQGRWGATFSAATYTWRSGLGIAPDGGLVYAMGDGLSPRTLAEILVNAGAVRAMELDVNVYWPAFDYYTYAGPTANDQTPHRLLSNEHNPADHYWNPGERDFFAVRSR